MSFLVDDGCMLDDDSFVETPDDHGVMVFHDVHTGDEEEIGWNDPDWTDFAGLFGLGRTDYTDCDVCTKPFRRDDPAEALLGGRFCSPRCFAASDDAA